MKNIAHISFEGGALIVATRTPYDRQQLFEHVESCAKHHRSIRLAVDRREWTISVDNPHREVCARCSGSPRGLIHRVDRQMLCGRCARGALH